MAHEPDYVFDDHAIRERWWEFLRDAEPEPGDEIRVETSANVWQSRMAVIEDPRDYATDSRDVVFEGAGGAEYAITISELHPLEPRVPSVRTVGGYDSRGEIERVEVYKA